VIKVMSHNDLTPQNPEAYLALRKFSQRIKCRRTGSPVSFADLGDEAGVPLLWMMPSGGSRWFAAAHGMFILFLLDIKTYCISCVTEGQIHFVNDME
jgi:hypothetical protein